MWLYRYWAACKGQRQEASESLLAGTVFVAQLEQLPEHSGLLLWALAVEILLVDLLEVYSGGEERGYFEEGLAGFGGLVGGDPRVEGGVLAH